jgi:hypothetical protein
MIENLNDIAKRSAQLINKSNQGGGSVNPGIGDAITADVSKSFQALTPIVQSFGGILADTITDALDPNRPGRKSLKQRFVDFFKSLPLLLLGALSGQGGKAGGAVGLAAGGPVRAGGVASLAHQLAPRGFALGGAPAAASTRATASRSGRGSASG